jgi:Pyruvate/2-oxoacid:ferredoxin oxidoreductase gamma subunit
MTPVDAQHWVREEMTKAFPLGVFRDRMKDATPRPAPAAARSAEEIIRLLGIENGGSCLPRDGRRRLEPLDLRIKVAGFGGQGVLLLGEILAGAGMDAGLEVSWLPSYGPEMRSGTSHCHVRLSTRPVDSPVVSRPNVLLALNEPSLRKFLATVEAGGLVLYNGRSLPDDCRRSDLRFVVGPFTELADQLGEPRSGNVVMLGALLEETKALPPEPVETALRRLVKSSRWLEIDRRAVARGREAAKEGADHDE